MAFCEVAFAWANLRRLRHKTADTPSSHSPTHGVQLMASLTVPPSAPRRTCRILFCPISSSRTIYWTADRPLKNPRRSIGRKPNATPATFVRLVRIFHQRSPDGCRPEARPVRLGGDTPARGFESAWPPHPGAASSSGPETFSLHITKKSRRTTKMRSCTPHATTVSNRAWRRPLHLWLSHCRCGTQHSSASLSRRP